MARNKHEATSDQKDSEQPQQAESHHEHVPRDKRPAAHHADVKQTPEDPQLQQEIRQAFQPILADFQQHIEQVIQQQIAEALRAERREQETPIEAEKPPQAHTEPPEGQPAQTASSDGHTGLSGLLAASSDMLMKEGQQLIRSLLSPTLDAVFSDSVRQGIQHQAERSVVPLLQVGLQALPDPKARKELQQQAETTLQTVLREVLNATFADEARAEVQPHMERAINAIMQGDVETARSELERGLRLLIPRIVDTIRRYKDQLTRLVLRIALTALQEALESVEEKTASKPPDQGEPLQAGAEPAS